MFDIQITFSVPDPPDVLAPELVRAARRVLENHQTSTATISIAVVDDNEMHQLNRRYLDHDYPTDVLSFRLSQDSDSLDGEVIVSIDTATRNAAEYGWSTASELMLYVVHGTLHLLGYDDHQEDERRKMHLKQRQILADLGYEMKDDDEPSHSGGKS